jgi:hypothetical protein
MLKTATIGGGMGTEVAEILRGGGASCLADGVYLMT